MSTSPRSPARPARSAPPVAVAALGALLLLACAGEGPEGSATEDSETSEAGTASATSTSTSTGGSETSTASASATTSDTSTTTASTTGGESSTGEPLGCDDLPLCDDFEGAAAGGPPDPARWVIAAPNCSGTGALQVDDAVAHSGGRSLRVDGGGGYCDHVFIANEAAVQALGDVIYGRFYVRLGAPLGPGHVTFMTLRDSADSGGKDLRMGGQSEILMWNRESDDATLPVLSPAGIALSVKPSAEAWHCVEFKVDASGLLETSVDGAAVAGLEVDADPTPDVDQQWHQKADWAPKVVDFKLGWESYAGQTMTLWFDDVALAAAPIGCD
ncbi:MAG: hypothetical protein R3B09_05030 [Nannocystaceae bacterium]